MIHCLSPCLSFQTRLNSILCSDLIFNDSSNLGRDSWINGHTCHLLFLQVYFTFNYVGWYVYVCALTCVHMNHRSQGFSGSLPTLRQVFSEFASFAWTDWLDCQSWSPQQWSSRYILPHTAVAAGTQNSGLHAGIWTISPALSSDISHMLWGRDTVILHCTGKSS